MEFLIRVKFVDKGVMGAMRTRPDWESYFMTLAAVAATRSTCLRRQVGAVIVRDGQIISTGYNGSPKGTPHCSETGCLRSVLNIPSGERQEMCRGSHAEMNAISQAASLSSGWAARPLSASSTIGQMAAASRSSDVSFSIWRILPFPVPAAQKVRGTRLFFPDGIPQPGPTKTLRRQSFISRSLFPSVEANHHGGTGGIRAMPF